MDYSLLVGIHDVDRAEFGQRLQHVPRPDTVAPVRRKRQAVREEEDLVAVHPSPREIMGPRQLATASGSLDHSFTCTLYFGSSGFTLRLMQPSAVFEA